MTKRHFYALADALASIRPDPANGTFWFEEWERAVVAVAHTCEQSNQRFDRTKFIKACKGR